MIKMINGQRRHEIKDEEWERIRHFFPERNEHTMGRPRKDARTMLNGILWIQATGAPWRDLPEYYGAWQTVYKAFARWEKEGLFAKIFEALIKAHKDSAGARKKGAKGERIARECQTKYKN